MSWIVLTIIATACWAIVNVVHKYNLSKWSYNPFITAALMGLVTATASVVIYFVQGFDELSWGHIVLALFIGALDLLAFFYYLKAVNVEEVSRIVPLFNLIPFFIAVLAGVFLGEVFTFSKYVGMFLILAGATWLSIVPGTRFRLSYGFWIMLFSAFIAAVSSVLFKYLLDFADFWTVFAINGFGTLIALLPIIYLWRKDFRIVWEKYSWKPFVAIAGNEALNVVGALFFSAAISISFVTLASVFAGGMQPFIVLLLTVLISLFFPHLGKEDISLNLVLKKLFAIVVMVVGVYLIG